MAYIKESVLKSTFKDDVFCSECGIKLASKDEPFTAIKNLGFHTFREVEIFDKKLNTKIHSCAGDEIFLCVDCALSHHEKYCKPIARDYISLNELVEFLKMKLWNPKYHPRVTSISSIIYRLENCIDGLRQSKEYLNESDEIKKNPLKLIEVN